MTIMIVTPLYPPDVAPLAEYSKELASRLSKEHAVEILHYGRLPEHVDGVSMISVDKRRVLPLRLYRFFVALMKVRKHTDYFLVQNGPSVELPVLILTFFSKTPVIFHTADSTAALTTRSRTLERIVNTLLKKRVAHTVASNLPPKPEQHPFNDSYNTEIAVRNAFWEQHLNELKALL